MFGNLNYYFDSMVLKILHLIVLKIRSLRTYLFLFENIFASHPQNQEMVQKAVMLFESHYAKQFNQNTKLYEGVSKMLSFLQARGFKMAILSNKPDSFTKMCAVK